MKLELCNLWRKSVCFLQYTHFTIYIRIYRFLKIISGAICRKSNIFFHTDAAQAVGKIPLDVSAMNIDLMSISGHKLYGPKGLPKLKM